MGNGLLHIENKCCGLIRHICNILLYVLATQGSTSSTLDRACS